MVEDRVYTQVPGNTENFPDCKKNCVYETQDEPGFHYCFKNGQKAVTCLGGNVDNVKYF